MFTPRIPKKTLWLSQEQVTDLRLNQQKGMTGATQALKLLESGYTVILIDREKLPANISQEYSDAYNYPKSVLSVKTLPSPQFQGKFLEIFSSLFKRNDDTQIYLNWNTIFEKYWFIWSINSFFMSFFRSVEDQDNLVKKNIEEIQRVRANHPQINLPNERNQIRLFKTEQELLEYETFLTRLNIPFRRSSQPNQDIQQEFYGGLIVENSACINNKVTTQSITSYCRQKFQYRFFELYNTQIRQLVLNPNNHVIGVNTTQGYLFQQLSFESIILSDFLVFCASHRTKYLTDLLGYRVPLLPLREWTLKPKTFSVSHDIFTPSVNFVNNSLSGQYEIGMDKDMNSPIDSETDGKYLKTQFTRLTNIEIDKCEVRSFLRAVTPDSKPIISKVRKFPNVFVNVGHDFQFGAASAIDEIIKGSQEWETFTLERYYLI